MLTSNVEPRRIVKHSARTRHSARAHQRCQACGARGSVRSHDLPFCNDCFDWARQRNLVEWDDLGGGD